MNNYFDEAIKISKIIKFNGEIRTKSGTFLNLDGEFGTKVSVKVKTSEGLVDLADGPYVLACPYDGVIIEVQKGKIVQIINPLKNEPIPNPLETPPAMADGAVGIVSGVYGTTMEKQNIKMEKFEDNTISNANGGTNDENADQTSKDQTTAGTVYTIEQLSSMFDDITAQLQTISDRVDAIEKGNTPETTNDTNTASTSTDQTNTNEQKMSAENIKTEVDKQLKNFLEKNSPARFVNRFEADEIENENIDPVMAQVRMIQAKKLRNKK